MKGQAINNLRVLMEDPTKKMSLQMIFSTGAIGLLLVIVGAVGIFRPPGASEIIVKAPVGLTPIMALAIGVSITVVSVVGVYGSISENEIVVYLYGALFGLVTAAVAALGGMALYALVQNLNGSDLKAVQDLLRHYTNDTKEEIDDINRKFKCCGLDGYESWPELGGKSLREMNKSAVMPASCCAGTTREDDKRNVKCTRDHSTYVACDDLVVREKFTMALYSSAASLVLLGFFLIIIVCSFFLATEMD